MLDRVGFATPAMLAEDPNSGWNLLRSTLERALALACEGSHLIQAGVPREIRFGPLFEALCSFDKQLWTDMLELSQVPFPADRGRADQQARGLLIGARTSFHAAFIRVGGTYAREDLAGLIEDAIEKAMKIADISLDHVRFQVLHAPQLPDGMRYVLWSRELIDCLQALCKEAIRWASDTPSGAPHTFQIEPDIKAKLWIGLRLAANGAPQLTFWNRGNLHASETDFRNARNGLLDVYCELGGDFNRDIDAATGVKWFISNIDLMTVSGGQK